MILRSLGEVEGAAYADLRESLAWWIEGKLFIGRAAKTGPRHQIAMIAAIQAELKRRDKKVSEAPELQHRAGAPKGASLSDGSPEDRDQNE